MPWLCMRTCSKLVGWKKLVAMMEAKLDSYIMNSKWGTALSEGCMNPKAT